jgi:hypothetical protein
LEQVVLGVLPPQALVQRVHQLFSQELLQLVEVVAGRLMAQQRLLLLAALVEVVLGPEVHLPALGPLAHLGKVLLAGIKLVLVITKAAAAAVALVLLVLVMIQQIITIMVVLAVLELVLRLQAQEFFTLVVEVQVRQQEQRHMVFRG